MTWDNDELGKYHRMTKHKVRTEFLGSTRHKDVVCRYFSTDSEDQNLSSYVVCTKMFHIKKDFFSENRFLVHMLQILTLLISHLSALWKKSSEPTLVPEIYVTTRKSKISSPELRVPVVFVIPSSLILVSPANILCCRT